MSRLSVPVVSIGPWTTGDRRDREVVARSIDDACRAIGFVAVADHGLDPEIVENMLASVDALFALDLADKTRCVPADPSVNRGYAAYGSEALAYSLGRDTLPDMFEAYNMGTHPAPDPQADDPHNFYAANIWPTALPGLDRVWQTYFNACRVLARRMDEIFELALGLAPGHITERTSRGGNVMRVNHYVRLDEHAAAQPGQMRMGEHTDYGVCTLLWADPVPGLQIRLGGTWYDVAPEPGTLLVNLGDLLAEWTNDRWRSTLHRVVPPPVGSGPARRRSIAFFHEADPDALIEPMPTCVSAQNPARYPPITAGEHLIAKLLGPRTLSPTTLREEFRR